MKTVFSTSDVHPRDAYSYWHDVLTAKIIKHNCRPRSRHAVAAKLQIGALTDVDLLVLTSSEMRYEVTSKHVGHMDAECFFVFRPLKGTLNVEQDGREVVLESGHITVADSRRPVAAKYSEGSKTLLLKVPVRQLEMRLGNVQQLMARAIRPVAGEHRLTSRFLAMLPAEAESLKGTAAEMIRDHTMDLIAASLAKLTDGETPRVSSSHALTLTRLRAAVEARLADPTLDAAGIAAAARISVRYANEVLAAQGTSLMRLVKTRRLERCRLALEDPLQTHRTISDIAYSWGFSDMTHFGRVFRSAYGLLPKDHRVRCRGAAAPGTPSHILHLKDRRPATNQSP